MLIASIIGLPEKLITLYELNTPSIIALVAQLADMRL